LRNYILVFLLLTLSLPAHADNPRQLFSKYADRLYQIKVLEKTSSRKSAIGSGFVVRPDGLMVTNYHVISKFMEEPDKYFLEAVSVKNKSKKIIVQDIDVVNDLALVKLVGQAKDWPYLKVASKPMRKGDPIYSMGNPLDLGASVVPGTYNGLTDQSYYQRIHMTGAINSGMSGGPVLNGSGKVIGVNVATAGNQIGFLVVADKLSKLLNEYDRRGKPPADFQLRIQQQLIANQRQMMRAVMASNWKTVQLGKASVLKEIAPFLPCWGDKSRSRKKKEKYSTVSVNCVAKENIYLNQWFRSGMIEVQYKWVNNISLTPMQFSTVMGTLYGSARAGNRASERDVTEFSCHEGFVDEPDERVALCTRAYKKYPDLYDVLYIASTVGVSDQGLMSHFTLSGVEKKTAMQFIKRFMEASQWN